VSLELSPNANLITRAKMASLGEPVRLERGKPLSETLYFECNAQEVV